jgi:hypothetical protein
MAGLLGYSSPSEGEDVSGNGTGRQEDQINSLSTSCLLVFLFNPNSGQLVSAKRRRSF